MTISIDLMIIEDSVILVGNFCVDDTFTNFKTARTEKMLNLYATLWIDVGLLVYY